MNLLNKIIDAIKNTSKLDEVLKEIEKYQSDLMKNINSSMLDNKKRTNF